MPPSPPLADHLLIVGRTNRRALLAGVASVSGATVEVTRGRRPRPRPWTGCGSTSAPGDAVLYENDLPDHYP